MNMTRNSKELFYFNCSLSKDLKAYEPNLAKFSKISEIKLWKAYVV